MIPNKIIYTDGHDVVVTDSTFRVKKTDYRLDGIIKHGLYVLRPSRLPSIILVLVGLTLLILGFAGLIPSSLVKDVTIGDTLISANAMAIIVGGFLALIGVVAIGFLRNRYAVRISTAEGEKNVVVSPHKEYVAQIVDAISSSGHAWRTQALS
jgi:Family of unknown function (DUF6232)